MKRILLLYLLPFAIAVAVIRILVFNSPLNKILSLHSVPSTEECRISLPYISNFSDAPWYENEFLRPLYKKKMIYILGSSELSEAGDAIPYTFLPKHYHVSVVGLGHAGNQCFSIFSQLLANRSRLNGAKIVFIISPGWFEAKASKGTSPQIFLEYNSEAFLKRILHDHLDEDQAFKAYEEKRVSGMYSEFNSPNLPLKLLNFEHLFSKSIFHEGILCLPMMLDHHLISLKSWMTRDRSECPDPAFVADSGQIMNRNITTNWDSLLTFSKNETLKKVTNNDIGVEDNYYTQYIGEKRGKIEPVRKTLNQELEDFKMLVALCKTKHIDATFVISPLNPLYFQNQKDIQPTIDIITGQITAGGFTYLNLLETDPAKYEKGILHDVMHMSDYGWYLVDRYIVDQYIEHPKHSTEIPEPLPAISSAILKKNEKRY